MTNSSASESRDEYEFHVEYFVVCVIDILGQRERLAGWAQLPIASEFATQALPAIKRSAGTVLALKQQFEDYFREFEIPRVTPEQLAGC